MAYQWQTIRTVRIDGIPKGQPRARSRKGQMGVYDPGTADGWKSIVADAFRSLRPPEPFDEPLRVDIDFYIPRPKGFNKRVRTAYGGSSRDIPKGVVLFLGKPDIDNATKAVLDTLTQIGFMRDDSLVCDGRIRKFYHGEGGRPGAQVIIMVWRNS